MSAAIYVRQSLDRDGSGAAVERQLQECRELANRIGASDAAEFIDNDVSASKGIRPAFELMLQGIQSGQIKQVIVWHVDRLYRKLRDLTTIIEAAERAGLRIHTVQAGDLDLSTPSGRMLAGILASAARFEVEQKGARQAAANLQRAAAGRWHFSSRPFGYRRVNGRVEIVPEEAAVIREGYDRYIAGESFYAIARDFNRRAIPTISGKAWSTTQVRERLRNPAYAGIRSYRGEELAVGDWEPLIDRATWDQFNFARARRSVSHPWSNKTKYLLSGIAICGVCNGSMFARPAYGKAREDGTKPVRMTYQCVAAWCVSRDMTRVDEVVESAIVARLTQPDWLELLRPAVDILPLMEESQELRRRRDDLAALLADGHLTAAAVRESSIAIQARLSELQASISAADNSGGVAELASGADVAHAWNTQMSLSRKRAVITAVAMVTIEKQGNPRRFDPAAVKVEFVGD